MPLLILFIPVLFIVFLLFAPKRYRITFLVFAVVALIFIVPDMFRENEYQAANIIGFVAIVLAAVVGWFILSLTEKRRIIAVAALVGIFFLGWIIPYGVGRVARLNILEVNALTGMDAEGYIAFLPVRDADRFPPSCPPGYIGDAYRAYTWMMLPGPVLQACYLEDENGPIAAKGSGQAIWTNAIYPGDVFLWGMQALFIAPAHGVYLGVKRVF